MPPSKAKATIDRTHKRKSKGGSKSKAKGQPYLPPDPWEGLEPSGNIETDSETELNALQKGFQERAQKEADRFVLATDSEFWFAVCFESREQKELFLQALEWITLGDKYLDGTELARQLGIPLPEVYLANRNAVKREDKKLVPLTRDDS